MTAQILSLRQHRARRPHLPAPCACCGWPGTRPMTPTELTNAERRQAALHLAHLAHPTDHNHARLTLHGYAHPDLPADLPAAA